MKLDPCCVRDIALAIEDLCGIGDDLKPNDASLENLLEHPKTSKYSKKELAYTVKIMEEAGFLKANFLYADNRIYLSFISALTYEGHKFLDTIRNDTVFSKVLKKLSQVGTSISIDVFKTVVASVFTSFLEQ